MLDYPSGFSRRQAALLTGFVELMLLGCGLVIGFGLGIVIGVSRAMHTPTPGWADPHSPVFAFFTNTVGFALGTWFALSRLKATWRELFTTRHASPVVYAVMIVALIGTVMVQSEISNVAQWIHEPPAYLRALFTSLADLGKHPIAAPLILVVVAPVTEELFFRGLILRRLLAVRPAQQAIWASALLFMLFHLNPWQFPVALALGLLLAWVYARTRSLELCIVSHAFINAAGLLSRGLPFQIPGYNLEHQPGTVVFQPWWFDLLGAAALVLGVYYLARVLPAMPPRPIASEPPPIPLNAQPELPREI